jgi:hypothetical protein
VAPAERCHASWDLIKGKFGEAWNSFVADLELLGLRLQEAETAKAQAAERRDALGPGNRLN